MSIVFIKILIIIFVTTFSNWLQRGSRIKRLAVGSSEQAAIEVYQLRPLLINSTIVNLIFYSIFCSFLLFNGPVAMVAWFFCTGIYTIISLPFFAYAMKKQRQLPHLRDYSGVFQSTAQEYMKLRTTLDATKNKYYQKMTRNLWQEINAINQRRHLAISHKNKLKSIETDITKLLVTYEQANEQEKYERTKARLDKIYVEEERTKDFMGKVEKQINDAAHLFMDIRTNISLDESAKIATDITSLTSQIKSLEYSVEVIDY
jgi:hypothetical protein